MKQKTRSKETVQVNLFVRGKLWTTFQAPKAFMDFLADYAKKHDRTPPRKLQTKDLFIVFAFPFGTLGVLLAVRDVPHMAPVEIGCRFDRSRLPSVFPKTAGNQLIVRHRIEIPIFLLQRLVIVDG